jgi:hypothetical protein
MKPAVRERPLVSMRPTLTAARTGAAAWKNQCTQPVAALSA